MDIVYHRGSATVAEMMESLSGQPAYSTVRAQLRVLEQKGHLRHEERGFRYVYFPTVRRREARQSMLQHLVDTFFEGSAGQVMAALLGGGKTRLAEEELDRIEQLIEKARRTERP